MSTDRDLLEMAAKAAGLVIMAEQQARRDRLGSGNMGLWVTTKTGGDNTCWNPLEDDGDALRLAISIGPLEFKISSYGTAVRRPNGQWFGCESHVYGVGHTRRAIVIMAAQIGSSIP